MAWRTTIKTNALLLPAPIRLNFCFLFGSAKKKCRPELGSFPGRSVRWSTIINGTATLFFLPSKISRFVLKRRLTKFEFLILQSAVKLHYLRSRGVVQDENRPVESCFNLYKREWFFRRFEAVTRKGAFWVTTIHQKRKSFQFGTREEP